MAHALADVDPEDRAAVRRFYEAAFPSYPKPAQALISDFLIGQTGVPTAPDLAALKKALSKQAMPELAAPGYKTERGERPKSTMEADFRFTREKHAESTEEVMPAANTRKGRTARKTPGNLTRRAARSAM